MFNSPPRALSGALLACLLFSPLHAASQDAEPDAFGDAKLVVEPTALSLELGEKAVLTARVVDGQGEVVDIPIFFFSRNRRGASVDSEGNVEGLAPGEHKLVVRTSRRGGRRLSAEVMVDVAYPRGRQRVVRRPARFHLHRNLD